MSNVFLIGFGNMGEAIVKTLTAKSLYAISVAERNDRKAERLEKEYGIKADRTYSHLKEADIVIIAVKPQDFPALAEEIKGRIGKDSMLVSIAAGVAISKLAELFQHEKLVRIMPNIGLRVGEGIAAWKSSALSKEEKVTARKFLDDLSDNFEVDAENLLDSVTAISGSGPAYFFYLAKELEKSAIELGISGKDANILVRKTLSAAAALQGGWSYDELIKEVASKGGTTEAALKPLEAQGFALAVEKAVRAAEARAKEIS